MKEVFRGFVVLVFATGFLTTAGCSRGSGNSGGPARQSTPARQATLAALSTLKTTATTVQTSILQTSPQQLNDFPALTGLLLTASLAQSLDFSPIGNDSGTPSISNDVDIEVLILIMMSSVAKEAEDDLKQLMAELEEVRKQNAPLMTLADKFLDDLEAAAAAINTEAQERARKQDASSASDSAAFSSFGHLHVSGRADRNHVGGLLDPSPAIGYDARAGEFSASLRCYGPVPQFYLQVVNLWSGQELARVAAVAGISTVNINLSERTAIGVRAIAKNLPYGHSTRCPVSVTYRRRLGAPAVNYTSADVGPVFDSISQLANGITQMGDVMDTLLADHELSPDDYEGILEQQDVFNTFASSALPSQENPFGNLEPVGPALGSLDNWALDAQKKLQDIMAARSKNIQLLTNMLTTVNGARKEMTSNIKPE